MIKDSEADDQFYCHYSGLPSMAAWAKTNNTNQMIDLDRATLVGEGKWVKDSAHRVYELDGKYFSVIVIGQQNLELFEDSIQEIQFEDISKYI